MSYNMGSLNTENYELKKNLSELETIRKQLNEEYTQIKNKQITIETAQSSQRRHVAVWKANWQKQGICLKTLNTNWQWLKRIKIISKQNWKT